MLPTTLWLQVFQLFLLKRLPQLEGQLWRVCQQGLGSVKDST